jgi:hypothetical protein
MSYPEPRRNDRLSASDYFRRFVRNLTALYFNVVNRQKIFSIKEGNYLWIEQWKTREFNFGRDQRTAYRIKKIVWVDWFTSPYIECDTKPEIFIRLEDLAEFTVFDNPGPKYKVGDYLCYNQTKYHIDNIIPSVVYYENGHYTPKLIWRYFGHYGKFDILLGAGENYMYPCPPVTRTWNELNNVEI